MGSDAIDGGRTTPGFRDTLTYQFLPVAVTITIADAEGGASGIVRKANGEEDTFSGIIGPVVATPYNGVIIGTTFPGAPDRANRMAQPPSGSGREPPVATGTAWPV